MDSSEIGERESEVNDTNWRINNMNEFSHLDSKGDVKMVDVTDKTATERMAKAEGKIHLQQATIALIQDDSIPKGNVLTTAKIAGIQSAKKTAEIILCVYVCDLSTCRERKVNHGKFILFWWNLFVHDCPRMLLSQVHLL